MPRPRTIHDFYGFPPELFDFHYPAPGAPDCRTRDRGSPSSPLGAVSTAINGAWIMARGACSPICTRSRRSSRPTLDQCAEAVRLSFRSRAPLAALRERGIMILASGNVVHNLGPRRNGTSPTLRSTGPRGSTMPCRPAGGRALARCFKADRASGLCAGRADSRPFHPAALPRGAGRAEAIALDAARPGLCDGLAFHDLLRSRRRLGCEEGEGAATIPEGVPPDQTNI